MIKHGILLAGGTGSRVAPFNTFTNKSLLWINGKPIIDYPIQSLIDMGCTDITVILGGDHFSQVVTYLKDGSQFGVNFSFIFQSKPIGIAQAIYLAKNNVINESQFAVLLGDNYFSNKIVWNPKATEAQILLANHPQLQRFGVASIKNNEIIKIEEKPKILDSNFENYAVSGAYVFTPEFFDFFQQTKPSARNEFEITEIIDLYRKSNKLSYSKFDGLWHDLGTHESIAYINNYLYNQNKAV